MSDLRDYSSPREQPDPLQPASAEEIGTAVLAALRAGQARTAGPYPPPSATAVGRPLTGGVPPGSSRLPVNITLRPVASGLPIGFFGLVTASTVFGAQALGFLPPTASVAIGLVLLPTAIAQLLGGIFALLSRDVISASLITTFSGVWLGTALVYLVHPAHGLTVLAFWYLALCPVIAGLISSATAKLALSMVPIIGLPTFLVTGIWLLIGGHALALTVGALSLALAAVGLYAAVALLLEDARRHTVIPTLRRGPMREAFTGDFDSQLRDLEHEAGVRRYL